MKSRFIFGSQSVMDSPQLAYEETLRSNTVPTAI
ncbi:MAG: hypothetical protein JWO10_35 [Microbacteriaceae bacterium]|nr:hypothetical protein [Microbacteriaceae bacterium]